MGSGQSNLVLLSPGGVPQAYPSWLLRRETNHRLLVELLHERPQMKNDDNRKKCFPAPLYTCCKGKYLLRQIKKGQGSPGLLFSGIAACRTLPKQIRDKCQEKLFRSRLGRDLDFRRLCPPGPFSLIGGTLACGIGWG